MLCRIFVSMKKMLNKITKHLFPDSKEWAWEQYILLCVKGSAIGLLDNKLVTLNPNDVLYKTKVTFISITSVSDDAEFIQLLPNYYFEIFFQGILAKSTEIQPFNSPLLHLKPSDTHTIIKDAHNLFFLQEKLQKESSSVKQELLQMQYGLLCVYSCLDVLSCMIAEEKPLPKSATALLPLFVKLLYANCYEQRNVAFYAKQMNMSVSHFSHKIQEVSGRTPKYWIDKITMELLKNDLNKKCTINHLVEKYHFVDAASLRRYIRRNSE